MNYQPSTWEYVINKETGHKNYKDDRLNIVQQNLYTLFDLIDAVRIDSNIELLYIQNTLNTKTVKNPTVQIIGLFASKIIEGLGVVFTAGQPPAIIATILSKLVSATITHVCDPQSHDSYNMIQGKVNDIKLAMDEIFLQIELEISKSIENLEHDWDKDLQVSLSSDEKIKLSELGNFDFFFPEKPSTDFILARKYLVKHAVYILTKELLPVKWKIKRQRAFPSDGVSNFLCGWQVEFYKVRSRNTWDKWRKYSRFPEIPNDIKDDVEGPYEYIEFGDDSTIQRFMGYGQNFTDYTQSKKVVDGSSKWMGWGGSNPPMKNKNNDIIKGTSFLDLIQDILRGKYFGSGQFSYDSGFPDYPSYFLWYKTKKQGEDKSIINDKRYWTLMGNNSCTDWVYDSNSIFTWGRAYRGIKLNHYYLVDENDNHASDELCKWLFKDSGHYFDTVYLKDGRIIRGFITHDQDDKITITDIKAVGYRRKLEYTFKKEDIDKITHNETIINENAVATKEDIYINWLS